MNREISVEADLLREDFYKEMDRYYDGIIENKKMQAKLITNERLLSNRVLKRVIEHYDELGNWQAEGVVEIELTEDKKTGRPNQCARIKEWKDKRYYLFHRQHEGEIKGINHIFIWQNDGGYLGDSYSGWSLIPLSDGRYWKIAYQC